MNIDSFWPFQRHVARHKSSSLLQSFVRPQLLSHIPVVLLQCAKDFRQDTQERLQSVVVMSSKLTRKKKQCACKLVGKIATQLA